MLNLKMTYSSPLVAFITISSKQKVYKVSLGTILCGIQLFSIQGGNKNIHRKYKKPLVSELC